MFAVTPWSSRHHLRINVLWRNHIFCHITPRKQGFGLSEEQQSCESGRRTVDWGQSQPPWPWQPRRPPAVKSAAGSPAIKVPQPATEINHPFFKDTKSGHPKNIFHCKAFTLKFRLNTKGSPNLPKQMNFRKLFEKKPTNHPTNQIYDTKIEIRKLLVILVTGRG